LLSLFPTGYGGGEPETVAGNIKKAVTIEELNDLIARGAAQVASYFSGRPVGMQRSSLLSRLPASSISR
jgi:hypothetical protein